jgi:small subunit ribosomal protein S7
MSRRKAAPKRSILPDPLFKSQLLAKFINCIMKNGKKSVAEKIVYGALSELIKRKRGKAGADGDDDDGSGSGSGSQALDIRTSALARERALELFKEALDNITPSVEVKSRRVGGSTYQVPVEIRGSRRMALAMRWLGEFSGKRGEKTMVIRLAGELMDATEGRGGSVKKREDTHRMAKANQAFAHFRW